MTRKRKFKSDGEKFLQYQQTEFNSLSPQIIEHNNFGCISLAYY